MDVEPPLGLEKDPVKSGRYTKFGQATKGYAFWIGRGQVGCPSLLMQGFWGMDTFGPIDVLHLESAPFLFH